MTDDTFHAALLFAGISLVFGLINLVTGKMEFGWGESDSNLGQYSGFGVRLSGLAMLLASGMLFTGDLNGYLVLVVAFFLPIVLRK